MELSVKDIKELLGTTAQPTRSESPYVVGKNYIIRTVTMIYTGSLRDVYEQELVIEDAAWVADTGRWSEALKTGELSEVESYPDGEVIIGRGAIIDAAIWSHDLPRETK